MFVIPVIVFLIVLEAVTWYIPNSYSYKYNYLKQHGKDLEAIAIGHSQLYDGFKPESFAYTSFNLSNSAQTYVDNYYLLKDNTSVNSTALKVKHLKPAIRFHYIKVH